MAQILAGDIRKGTTFEYKSGVYTVTEFQHVKPGKGAAFVRTTLKNVVTGQVLSDETFNPTTKLETAQVETKKMTYSYNDGEFYYFMDDEFNLTPLNHSQVEDALQYIRENDTVTVRFLYGNAFSVEPENFVELKVIEAEPGVKGQRHQGRKGRDGRDLPGPHVRRGGRHHPHRHENRGIYVESITATHRKDAA